MQAPIEETSECFKEISQVSEANQKLRQMALLRQQRQRQQQQLRTQSDFAQYIRWFTLNISKNKRPLEPQAKVQSEKPKQIKKKFV